MKGNTKLRQDNIKRLFCEIRDRGPISKRELQKYTDFSWGSISSIITELEDNGYIMSAGKQKGSVGRRPEEYDINITDNLIIGIDFSSVGFTAVVTDMRGRVIKSDAITFSGETKDSALKKLCDFLDMLKTELCGLKVLAIGFAMQGAVRDERISTASISGIDGWKNVPLAEIIEKKFGIKTVLIHDPDCIIRTEKHFGKLQNPDIKNAFLIRIDHGMGMSIMADRKPYIGHEGKSGEIGYTVVSLADGGYARLEEIVSEPAVVKNYKRVAGFKGDITCGEIADKARQGDKVSVELFEQIGTALGLALTNAVNLLYPETVVIFGAFSRYQDLYLDITQRVISENAYDTKINLVISELGHDSAAVGAALVASEKIIEEINFI